MEQNLASREYLAGDYSIADISTVTWVRGMVDRGGWDLANSPRVAAWRDRILARPAVHKALAWKP